MGVSIELADFGAECREAFLRYCVELGKINPNEPTKRRQNNLRRAGLYGYIDDVLDQYLDWQALSLL